MSNLKDPIDTLITDYYRLLDKTKSVNGTDVPIYDEVAPDASAPYIYVINATTNNQDITTRSSYSTTVTVELGVKTKHKTKNLSRSDNDSIINHISNELIARPAKLDLSPDYNLIASTLDNRQLGQGEKVKGGIVVTGRIRPRHLIEQL